MLGEVDELKHATIGLRVESAPDDAMPPIVEWLLQGANDLFCLGADLVGEAGGRVVGGHVAWLEHRCDDANRPASAGLASRRRPSGRAAELESHRVRNAERRLIAVGDARLGDRINAMRAERPGDTFSARGY